MTDQGSGRQMGALTLRDRLHNVRKRKQARDRLAAARIAGQLRAREQRDRRDHLRAHQRTR